MGLRDCRQAKSAAMSALFKTATLNHGIGGASAFREADTTVVRESAIVRGLIRISISLNGLTMIDTHKSDRTLGPHPKKY